MKRFATTFFCLALLIAGPALGDSTLPVPDTWSASLQKSTQEMVRAGIPAQDAIAMTSSMIQARFSRQEIQQAQHVVVKAHQKGLPVEPVISKALEGVAKQVPPRSIIRAMTRVTSRYAYAFQQASRLSTQKADIERLGKLIAAGLAAGMTHRDVNKMVGRLHNEARHLSREDRRSLATNALVTARDMARQGVTSAHAAQVVDRALQKGFKAHDMQALHESFLSRAATMPADQVARSFSKSMHEGTFDAMEAAGSHTTGMDTQGQMPAGMESGHGIVEHGGDMGGHGGNVGGSSGGAAGGDMGGHGGDMGGGDVSGGDTGGHGGAVGGGAAGGDVGGHGGDVGGSSGGDASGGAAGGDMGGHGGDMGGGGVGGGGGAGHH